MSHTAIAAIKNIDSERIPGETTAICCKAKRIMEEEASKTGPIIYTFMTDVKKLTMWAKSAGMEIFNWYYFSSHDDGGCFAMAKIEGRKGVR